MEFAVAAPLRAALVVVGEVGGILYLLHFLSVSVPSVTKRKVARTDDNAGDDEEDDTCSHSSEEGRRYER